MAHLNGLYVQKLSKEEVVNNVEKDGLIISIQMLKKEDGQQKKIMQFSKVNLKI
jgi:hypothetical protein